jgi:hypothetical protein
MNLRVIAAGLVAGAFAIAVYFGYGLMAGNAPLSESGLQRHLTAVMEKPAETPVDQVAAFHTTVRPHHSARFTGYEVVLSGFDTATCNQIMKSPWVENAASAKSLTSTCGDPKAEIHLLMPGK